MTVRVRFNGVLYLLDDPEVVTNRHGLCFDAARYMRDGAKDWETGPGGLFPLRDLDLIEPVPEQLDLAVAA